MDTHGRGSVIRDGNELGEFFVGGDGDSIVIRILISNDERSVEGEARLEGGFEVGEGEGTGDGETASSVLEGGFEG